MSQSIRSLGAVIGGVALLAAAAPAAQAASPAASLCPSYYFLSSDLGINDSFETPAPSVPLGTKTCWQAGGAPNPVSAADSWYMHSSNAGAKVCSKLMASTAPGPRGKEMVQFIAGGNEGGVYQYLNLDPAKSYMFSVWVYVRSGQVAIQSNNMTGGPGAWSSKIGEWEQLRVCNNSQFSANSMWIVNEDPNGGTFYVDRAEVREIPQLE